ncbi:hypothetical protein QN277_020541 [Acacia crassicarpa]|uniref:Uncharacterized protein n=2 Tax=Acacia crassicarpa TaxID=499986 RepID=A0AAE1JPS4_9FABA|nr:hypothetical protein QN277_020541 [Acacia crassicarpa]
MASLDHKDEEGSVNNLKLHLQHPEDNAHPISRKKQSRCSSSLSDSSLESVALENNEKDGIADTFESKHVPAMSYSSDNAYPSPVWSFQSASTPPHPPTQMMARPAGYDPNRIPLSIFSSRPANPLAWSYASNESLFSIQAGNNSFSKLHFFPADNKCVESAPNNCADNDIIEERLPDSLSTRVSFEETIGSPMVMQCESFKSLAESSTIVLHETREDNNSKKANAPREEAKNIASLSCRSEESRTSNRSFQFPLLSTSVKVGRKSKLGEKQEEDKALEAACAKADEKAPNARPRIRKRWYLPSCACSPCRCSQSNH